MTTNENTIVWVEVSRYCYPWHGDYIPCKIRLDAAVLWLRVSKWKVMLRYPESETTEIVSDTREVYLPTHFGFETEEDASYFKLLFDI